MLQIQSVQKSYLPSSFLEVSKSSGSSTIHSGHFMVSRVHEENEDDDEEPTCFNDDTKDFNISAGYDFLRANKETYQSYSFGPRSTSTLSIDASLTKLFECMTLAYSGKITSPKWKAFRGMHLAVKEKVRLNNIIWREWHMQYIYGMKPIVCQFSTPASDEIHTKPEAVVLEGKYWKRRLDTVTKEYIKWRRYYRDRHKQNAAEFPFFSMTEHLTEEELLERVKDTCVLPHSVQQSSTDLSLLNSPDIMEMDFDNNLLFSLNQPFAFPNPREFGPLCADLIQPGLVQLQPNLEDFMDIDTMQEFLAVSRSSGSGSFTPNASGLLSDMSSGMDLSQSNFQSSLGLMDMSNISNVGMNSVGINMLTALAALSSSNNNLASSASTAPSATAAESSLASDLDSFMDNLSGNQTFSSSSPSFFGSVETSRASPKPVLSLSSASVSPSSDGRSSRPSSTMLPQTVASNTTIQTLNTTGLGLTQTRIPPSTNLQTSATSHRPAVHQPSAVKPLQPKTANNQQGMSVLTFKNASSSSFLSTGRSQSSGQISPAAAQKDIFVVPQAKPAQSTRKPPRSIAPAPSPPTSASTVNSPSMQSTYLAQLLTKGTYPGAIINVKKEPISPSAAAFSTSNLTPILPSTPRVLAPSTAVNMVTSSPASPASVKLPPEIAMEINKVAGDDFPTSVLLAAASTALGTTSSSLKDVLRMSPVASTVQSCTLSSPSMPQITNTVSKSPPLLAMSPTSAMTPPSPSASNFEVISPVSSPMNFSEEEKVGHTEQRRVAHLSAEQKRRCSLKSGFDLLHTLVPSLAQNPKVSKATMLQKTAEYCRKMKDERQRMTSEAQILKQEIDALNSAISVVQSQLPETGVPVTRQRVDRMKDMFEDYVKNRTLLNWKFWIFSIIIRSLFDSYNSMVSTASTDDLSRTTISWLDQHCSLVSLRPTVLNALRHLSTTTSILSDPQQVREQATKAVTKVGPNNKGGKGQTGSNSRS